MKALCFSFCLIAIGCEHDTATVGATDPWTAQLQTALAGSDRLRVRSSGTCHRDVSSETTLYETKDAKLISGLVGLIAVDVPKSQGACMCCGSPTLEFYKAGTLILTLGVQHGRALRWLDGPWTADAQLTTASGDRFVKWMTNHRVGQPEKDRTGSLEQEAQASESEKRWLAAMPPSLRPYWGKDSMFGPSDKTISEMDSVLTKNIPDRNGRILALLGWFGSGESWNGYPAYEGTAETLLMKYTTRQLVEALAGRKLTSGQLDGAARLFSGELARKRPQERNLLPKAIRKQLLDYCRSSADADKAEWGREAFGG